MVRLSGKSAESTTVLALHCSVSYLRPGLWIRPRLPFGLLTVSARLLQSGRPHIIDYVHQMFTSNADVTGGINISKCLPR